MRKRWLGLLLTAAALLVAGCSTPGPPKVSFYAAENTVRTGPIAYCEIRVTNCRPVAEAATLHVPRGMPVQVSIPPAVAETPWTVMVQYRTSDGRVRITRETFTDREQYAYTADPPGTNNQILVVEVQQLGVRYALDKQGNLIVGAAGRPQLLVRGVWSLQVNPA